MMSSSYSNPTILPRPELAATLPKADARALMELSNASEVRAWTQHKVEDYKNHLSTVLTIHNTIVPINTLPTEILQQIFTNVPTLYETWCDALWMLSLGSVCHLWRSVLLATPEYWVRGLHTVMDPDFYGYYRGDNFDPEDPDDQDDQDITQGRALFLARSAPWPLEIPMHYSSFEDGPGWDVFEDHFDRVTLFEVTAQDADDLDDILNTVTYSMKRLETLRLVAGYPVVAQPLLGWEPEDLPRLGRLEITSALFCSVTAVLSLHTVILTEPALDMTSLSRLFAALKECPALADLRLRLTHRNNAFHNKTPERVLDLPNLRNLAVGGGIVNIQFFLSAISFPSATFVELNVADTDNEQDRGLVLPNVLPRRFPVAHPHQMLAGIDRLCFRSNVGARTERDVAIVVMRAYAQGAERLRVTPAFWLHSASHFLQILPLFRECSIAELALDLRRVPADVEGECWAKVFTALPDIRRLEMLSPRMGLREVKRDIATHYLASCRVLEPATFKTNPVNSHRVVTLPRRAVSLAWVLGAPEGPSGLSQMEAELHDVEQVLRSHVGDASSRLERLELYVADSEFHRYEPGPLGTSLTPVVTDDRACQLVTRDYISRLEAMADVVVVGGRRDLWTMMRKTKVMDENECYAEDDDDEEDS